MDQLTKHEAYLCKQIVDCAYKVHKTLGPGLLEKIYEICFCHELGKKIIPSQLRLTGKHVGFLINFNVTKIKDGIRRYCL